MNTAWHFAAFEQYFLVPSPLTSVSGYRNSILSYEFAFLRSHIEHVVFVF